VRAHDGQNQDNDNPKMAGKYVAMILHCPVWWCSIEWRRGDRDSFLQIDWKLPPEFKLNGLILITSPTLLVSRNLSNDR